MSDAAPPARAWRIDSTLNAGHLLTCATLVIGFSAWLLDGRGESTQALRDVADLKQVVASQAVSTRESIKESVSRVEAAVSGLQAQTAGLIPLTERYRSLEADVRRLEENLANTNQRIEARRNAVDNRFDQINAWIASQPRRENAR